MRRVGKYTKKRRGVRRAWLNVNTYILWFRNLKRWQKVAVVVGPILAVMILIPLMTYFYFARDISDKERLMNRNNTGVVLTDIHDTVIYQSGRAKHREMVPLDEMSDTTKEALLASEDRNFYEHDGFSVLSTLRAVYGYALGGGQGFGGSTLTQQLAKITVLSQERSFLRQYQAFSVAVAIEGTYTKDEILEMYLNSAFFGGNAFGIEDAAKSFFNKSPQDLTLAESAMIIGVLPAPNTYSPIHGSLEYARERQEEVLNRMVRNDFITTEERDAALSEELVYSNAQSLADESPAPHFAEMVMASLNKQYGEEKVARSGYQVKTTLDLNVQNVLQENITQSMASIRASGGSNAAATAIDPETGAVRALIGSYDWNDEQDGRVNMAMSARQPGSSFKPIYYAAAMADGVINPATILNDAPLDIDGWQPQNALRNFSGDVTARQALNWSLNIPAIKVMQRYGVDKSVEAANDLGITTIRKDDDHGLALALGSAEARLLDMTHAYAAFANAGDQKAVVLEEEVRSKYDQVVATNEQESTRAISEEGAFLISHVLADDQSRAGMFGSSLSLPGSKRAAVKTGTTDDNRDAWTIGYTPTLAVGVWVGNNDNSQMASGGGSLAGPIWRNAMSELTNATGNIFSQPSGVVERDVCYGLGKLANSQGTNTYKEYFLATSLPSYGCDGQQAPREEENKPEPEPEPEPAEPTTPTAPVEPPDTAEDDADEDSEPAEPPVPGEGTGPNPGGSNGPPGTQP